MDIDAVTLLGSEFDDNGKYVMWSPLADMSSIEKLEASQELPFPTGKATEIQINNNAESFFKTYDSYIRELFDIRTKDNVPVYNKEGTPILILKELTPERIKLLAQFLEEVKRKGLTIKGNPENISTPSPELIEEWNLPNSLLNLLFLKPQDAYKALEQIKALVDKHNLYINKVKSRTRELMTKNQCQWAIYQVCSTPSNLVELMIGVDVATDPIKNKKTGAVATSAYKGADKHTAVGNYYEIHRAFLTGLIGKQCVGIGAVSIKVNSTTQYCLDSILRLQDPALRDRILLPKTNSWGNRDNSGQRGYLIDGKRYLGLSNLYNKSAERVDYLENSSEDVIALLNSIETPEDITPNVALSLAAMLSVAVDLE